MKKVKRLFWVLAAVALTACNSNDDGVEAGIEIPGITITDDVDCCSAEEALQVYKFLQTVKIVPELSTEIDGKYNVFAYTRNGSFHNGYNEIYFVATKKATGNYIKNFELTNITPIMYMVKMDKYHSTPTGPAAESFDNGILAVKRSWVSFLMDTSEAGSWTLSYDALVLGKEGKVEKKDITPGEVVLDIKDLHAKDYRDVEILRGLNLNVRKGEIVGLCGVDGNGQTELVEVLTGLRKAESGTITMMGKDAFNLNPHASFEAGISSIPADRQKHGLVLDFSIEDNLIVQHYKEAPFSKNGIMKRDAIRKNATDLMEKFDVRPRGVEDRPAGNLSGGNQQKVIIAREVTNDKELLIAFNPTRGLDVGAIEFVHKYLVEQRNKGRAVLLVSFELDEIMSLSDRIEVIFDGEITGSVPGAQADEKELGFMMAGGKKNEN